MVEEIKKGRRRIGKAQDAIDTWTKLWEDSSKRRLNSAKVLNQLTGGKPFDPNKLIESGQGFRCNVNFRDAESSLEQVLLAYWTTVHDVTNLISVEIKESAGAISNEDDVRNRFELAFNEFIDSWGIDYIVNYLLMSMNHVAWGIGPLHFKDAESPRWVALNRNDIVVPDRTPANTDRIDLLFVRGEMTISELWDLVRNDEEKKLSEARGWNPEAITRFLARNMDGVNDSESDWERVEEKLIDNSYGVSAKKGALTLVHAFVKEYDGKVSHYIFDIKDESDKPTYLFDDFEIDARPESLSSVLMCIIFGVGQGRFDSVKGFGVKNYDLSIILNRLKSRAVDGTILEGLNFIDDETSNRSGEIPIINMGPFNILPKGLTQIPNYPRSQSVLETIAFVEQQQNFNNARYRDQQKQISSTETATQARILASLQSQVDIASATLYLKQLGRVFEEQMSRLRARDSQDVDVIAFKERCLEDNLMDEETFHGVRIKVRTGADPGAASAALKAQLGRELIEMSGSPLINERFAYETWVSNSLGPSAVHKALNQDTVGEFAFHERQALLENNAMGEGTDLPVAKQDKHEVHISVHMEPLERIVQAYQQSQDISPDHITSLEVVTPHLEQHFQFLRAEIYKKEIFQELWPRFTAVQSVAARIFARLEEMQRQVDTTGELPDQATQLGPGFSEQ